MAYLILEERGSDPGTEKDRYFEFDPSDSETLEKIEALLSRRNQHDTTVIDSLCSASIEKKYTEARKKRMPEWIRNVFRGHASNEKGRNRRRYLQKGLALFSRSRRYHAGKTDRFSFV
jgi:hypothetical protein